MTTDEFALALLERLYAADFWLNGLDQEALDEISRNFGTPRKTPEEVRGEPEAIDLDLVNQIARYLVEEEEMNPNDEDHELEQMLRYANFIYGFMQWKETPHGRGEI